MIPADPVLTAARALVAAAIPDIPVGIDDAPDAPEAVVIETGTSYRPGSLGCLAEDLALRVMIRGVARGPGAARRARFLAEQAAGVLLGARLAGPGWETAGWRHVADAPIVDAGDLANAIVELAVTLTPA